VVPGQRSRRIEKSQVQKTAAIQGQVLDLFASDNAEMYGSHNSICALAAPR